MSLLQRAIGGEGAFRAGPWGLGLSTLEWSGASREAELVCEASGRLAEAAVDARNALGDVSVRTVAISFGASQATADAYGEAQQDGTRVAVGVASAPFTPDPLLHGARGDVARSRSVGVHLGDGEVSVFDTAIGYDGGSFQYQPPLPIHGDAFSTATARNQGLSRVEAQADARGGRAELGEPGGNATAEAEATGLGEVLASAYATLDPWTTEGVAQARAIASGTSGRALADASEFIGGGYATGLQRLAARAGAEVASTVGAAAAVQQGTLASTEAGRADAQLVASALPDGAALAAALADDAAVAGALSGQTALAHAALAFAHSGQDDSPLTLDAELELWYDRDHAGPLQVGFFDAELLDGFDRLTVRIEDGGKRSWSKSFTKPEKLVAYFDDRVLSVKHAKGKRGEPPPGVLRLVFEAELGAPGDGAGFDFVILSASQGSFSLPGSRWAAAPSTVPEPRLLLLAGIIFALRVRRAKCPRSRRS